MINNLMMTKLHWSMFFAQ